MQRDTRSALDFHRKAFGAEARMSMPGPGGRIMHAELKRAVDAGARVIMPPSDMFWGDRFGKVTDPFGHHWAIATHTEDVSPEDLPARQAEWQKQMAQGK